MRLFFIFLHDLITWTFIRKYPSTITVAREESLENHILILKHLLLEGTHSIFIYIFLIKVSHMPKIKEMEKEDSPFYPGREGEPEEMMHSEGAQ